MSEKPELKESTLQVESKVTLFEVVEMEVLPTEINYEIVGHKDFQEQYSKLLEAIDQLEGIRKTVNEQVKELAKERYLIDGTRRIEGKKFNMSYIPESFRERFDIKKLQEEEPELYAELLKKYTRISKVSDSLRVNKKGGTK